MKRFKIVLVYLPIALFELFVGYLCYDEYITRAKELVIDQCIVRGISYDGSTTLLTVELPDHELAIVDGSIRQGFRLHTERPKVGIGDTVRCRWKYGDVTKLGYCNWRKGDISR